MFNKTYNLPRTIEVNSRTVEQRAPTDESVRLLREMEQKARAEILKTVRLDGNEFKAVIHHLRDELSLLDKYKIIFELNGEKHELVVDILFETARLNKIWKIREELSSYLAAYALSKTDFKL
jgi:uncharacterized Fe-S cluster-containing radical SAM superfamily protein